MLNAYIAGNVAIISPQFNFLYELYIKEVILREPDMTGWTFPARPKQKVLHGNSSAISYTFQSTAAGETRLNG